MRRLKQTGKSNEAKQERLSILCFWQMLTWFSEKMPQESKTGLLKERWNKYLTSWHTLYRKNIKRWVRIAYIYSSLQNAPGKRLTETSSWGPHDKLSLFYCFSFLFDSQFKGFVQLFRWGLSELIHLFSKLLHGFSKVVLDISTIKAFAKQNQAKFWPRIQRGLCFGQNITFIACCISKTIINIEWGI